MPEQGDGATGAQVLRGESPAQLRVNPMPGLGADQQIERLLKTGVFEAGRDDVDVRRSPRCLLEDRDHRRVRLDRGQSAGDRGETDGGLPGAGSDLKHSWVGAAGEGDHVLDEPDRIPRPDTVIPLRDLTEDPCPHPIRHQHTLRRRLPSHCRRNVPLSHG